MADFRLTSTAFADGEPIPPDYSCDGGDVSPPLGWEDAPDGTTAMALVVDDPDARGFIHWLTYNLAGSRSGSLPQGASASPDAPNQGRNDFGGIGWGGPCPPAGRPHRYRFRLLALDDFVDLSGAVQADDVLRAAEGHILGEATLTGTYQRGR